MFRLFLILIFLIAPLHAQTYLESTATVDERVQDLLFRMKLDAKVGQMTQADRGQLNCLEEVKSYF